MGDRICPKCLEDYHYPSKLKIHLKMSIKCKISDLEIDVIINKMHSIKKYIKTEAGFFKCNKCSKHIKHSSEFYKHYKKCNPNEQINIDSINFGQIFLINPSIKVELLKLITCNLPNQNMPNYIEYIYSLSINTVKLFNESLANSITKLIKSSKHHATAGNAAAAIAITNNDNKITHNIDNSNTANNIANNIDNSNNVTFNNCNFYHILPFGSENINKIPKAEMIRILRCGDNCSIEILQAVYKYEENRNFFRSNLKNTGITFLDTSHKLKVYKLQDFLYDVFNSCLNLIDQMLFVCRNDMSIEEINNVIMNRDRIEYSLFNEIYKQINSLVESEISNNNVKTRDKTKKYIENITQNIKLKEEAETHICKTKHTITQADLDTELGNPKALNILNQENINDDFITQRIFEKTQFYSHWIERIKEEREYLETKKLENLTIQDVKNHYERIRKIINNIKTMRQRHSDYIGVGSVNIELDELEDAKISKILETTQKYVELRDNEIDEELEIELSAHTADDIEHSNLMDKLIIIDDDRMFNFRNIINS